MPYTVDFNTVSTVGLESSPVAAALAGLRANEARYFKNKYDHAFTVEPASDAKTTIDWVHRILEEERGIVISSRPLEATAFQVENIRMAYVFYESGLSINVMYTVDDSGKRRSGSSSPKGWKSPQSSPHGSSSRGRSRSWPEPFAVPTSSSRTSTDPPNGSADLWCGWRWAERSRSAARDRPPLRSPLNRPGLRSTGVEGCRRGSPGRGRCSGRRCRRRGRR